MSRSPGSDTAPVLMLSNSLGTNLHMWDEQVPEWSKHFRVVRYDRRGHGKSGVPKGPYSMERFGRDVIAVLDGLNIKKTHWCGLSMGGMVGQWLGANAPGRIDKLILSNTHFNYADKQPWLDRIKLVEEKGLAPLVDPNMERWFTKGFRERAPEAIARMKEMFGAPPRPATSPAARRLRHGLHRLEPDHHRADAGDRRRAGPGDAAGRRRSHRQADQGRARWQSIDAAHIANIEQPKAYTETVLKFLS